MEENRCPGCMNIKSGGAVCEHCGYEERKQNAPHQLQTGTMLLDKYLVGRALGQGGFGITYLGWNRYLDTKVAIKEYYPAAFVDRNTAYHTSVVCRTQQLEEFYAENRMRFLREAKTLAKLQNVPQIVSIHDFFERNNTAYIVMEYLQGDDLRSYVRKRGGRLTPTETLNILRPVMAALVQVHEAGLVHRDISPDNIMLQYDSSVKLMDFGAVRSVNNPGVDEELTQATQAIVKHGFAPIEQYSAKGSIGPWTDEYALCATMYYCMTGKVPENAPERVQDGTEIDWDAIPGLTEHQKRILQKGTEVRPKDRYASIRELMDALFLQPKISAEEKPVKRERPEEKQKTAQKSGKKKIFLLIGAFVLVAAVFLAIPRGTNGWVEENGSWSYYEKGSEVTGWKQIKGCWYYFDDTGNMENGWLTIDGYRYFFGIDGKMQTGWKMIGKSWYYFGVDGKVQIGWKQIEDHWYYFEDNGAMAIGWRTIKGYKYYFDHHGKMATGLHVIAGSPYRFNDQGKLIGRR